MSVILKSWKIISQIRLFGNIFRLYSLLPTTVRKLMSEVNDPIHWKWKYLLMKPGFELNKMFYAVVNTSRD